MSALFLRGREGLRLWENKDFVPKPDDVFQNALLHPLVDRKRASALPVADDSRSETGG